MRTAIIIVIGVALVGCRSPRTVVKDHRFYDSGELMMEGEYFSVHDLGHGSEYFKNGRLKSEEWSRRGRPLVRLCFHPDGRIKSEERWNNDRLDYSIYYDEEGEIISTSGKRLGRWPANGR